MTKHLINRKNFVRLIIIVAMTICRYYVVRRNFYQTVGIVYTAPNLLHIIIVFVLRVYFELGVVY